MSSKDEVILHASCVAYDGRAVLIRGKAGAGKSTLALELMGYGAVLVGDDRVCLRNARDGLRAAPAPNIAGLIEARGMGLLQARHCPDARVTCVVDLDQVETERFPPVRSVDLLGQSVTLFWRVDGPHFAPALLQFLKSGRQTPK